MDPLRDENYVDKIVATPILYWLSIPKHLFRSRQSIPVVIP
jgi:hypothetical protein